MELSDALKRCEGNDALCEYRDNFRLISGWLRQRAGERVTVADTQEESSYLHGWVDGLIDAADDISEAALQAENMLRGS